MASLGEAVKDCALHLFIGPFVFSRKDENILQRLKVCGNADKNDNEILMSVPMIIAGIFHLIQFITFNLLPGLDRGNAIL